MSATIELKGLTNKQKQLIRESNKLVEGLDSVFNAEIMEGLRKAQFSTGLIYRRGRRRVVTAVTKGDR